MTVYIFFHYLYKIFRSDKFIKRAYNTCYGIFYICNYYVLTYFKLQTKLIYFVKSKNSTFYSVRSL